MSVVVAVLQQCIDDGALSFNRFSFDALISFDFSFVEYNDGFPRLFCCFSKLSPG